MVDAATKCSLCYKGSTIVKEVLGSDAIFIEDTIRGLKYVILLNPSAKSQTIVMCGTITEELTSMKQIQEHFNKFDITGAAEFIDNNIIKQLNKEYSSSLFAHSFGATIAMHFAVHLKISDYKIKEIITFGQPRSVKKKDEIMYKDLPIIRVVDFLDPFPLVPSSNSHFGPELILFEDAFYFFSSKLIDDPKKEIKFESNDIESYLKHLQPKLKSSISVPYEKMKKK